MVTDLSNSFNCQNAYPPFACFGSDLYTNINASVTKIHFPIKKIQNRYDKALLLQFS